MVNYKRKYSGSTTVGSIAVNAANLARRALDRQAAYYSKSPTIALPFGRNSKILRPSMMTPKRKANWSPKGPKSAKKRKVVRILDFGKGPRRKYGGPSKSAGFIRRGSGKYKVGKLAAMKRNGWQHTFEYGKVCTTTTQVQVIGHHTMPVIRVWSNIWRLLCKKLMYKAGRQFDDPSGSLAFLTVGDTIVVSYITTPGSGIATYSYTYASGNTIEDFVTRMTLNTAGFNNLISPPEFTNLRLIVSTLNSSVHPTQISLSGLMLDIYAKSSLKIQNRTVTNEANVESDDIDNAPLYGRTYEGTGNGTTWFFSGATTNLFAHNSYGNIEAEGTAVVGGTSWFGEPPSAVEFPGVKLQGKVRIEPGDIKTSVLTDMKTLNFNRFAAILHKYQQFTAGKPRENFGKFRFMALEKMLDATTALSIVTAYEHNLLLVLNCREKVTKITGMNFEKVYG